MKILYYSAHPYLKRDAPTGYGRHMREMIDAWKSQGHEVNVLIGGDVFTSVEESASSEVIPSGKKGLLKRLIPSLIWETLRDMNLLRFDTRMRQALLDAIKQYNPDVVYERITYLQTSGAEATRKTGVKHFLEINAPYPEERVSFSGKSMLLGKARRAEKKLLQNAAAVSVVSSALKSHFEALVPGIGKKITVVPNAVNENIERNVDKDALRKTHGIKPGLVIGFVGSIFPYHGVDILIQAFAKLIEKGQKAQLLIVGDGMILPEMKALTQSLNVSEDIVFTGSVPHDTVHELIKAMDICCMAKSNWYGSPVKIFEYGLHAKAVLAPNKIPVRDVMTNQDAEIVEADVNAVYSGLNKLVTDEVRRNQIAENWHRKVLNNYTWQQAAKTTISLCT